MSAAARRVSVTSIAPAAFASPTSSTMIRETGAIAAFTWSGWSTASWTENSMIGRRLCVPRLRGFSDGSHHSCRRIVNARRRSSGPVVDVDHGLEVVGRLANGLLEQCEQELVLAVEVLVEAAERLLRLVDDLLDRELGRSLLVDQLERGVEEALHPLLGAGTGRVQAAGDGPLAPGRLVRVSSEVSTSVISGKPAFTFCSLPAPCGERPFPSARSDALVDAARPSSRSARPASS